MPIALVVFRQVCVMALLIAAGWLLGRLGLLDKQGNAQLSSVLTGFIIPVVIFSAFLTLDASPAGLAQLGSALLLYGISFAVSIGAALLLFRHRQAEGTAVSRACTAFANNGFFGIPVVQAMFGDLGVFYASISVMYNNMIMWTWGASWFQTGSRVKARDLLKKPAAVAILLGLAVYLLRLWPVSAALANAAWFEHISAPLVSALNAVKATNTPVAMLVLGVNIYNAKWKPDRTLLRTLPAVALRQLVLPAVVLLLLLPLPADPVLVFSVYVASACPIAMLVSVMALRYGASPEQQRRATQIVVVSNLSALVTVPLMVALGSLLIAV